MINRIQLDSARAVSTLSPRVVQSKTPNTRFAELLADRIQEPGRVKFSAHALRRLEARGLSLSPTEQAQVQAAVDQAAAKGARETLLVLPRAALVVNIPNRTVITAVGRDELENTIFTNIDSAVLVASPLGGAATRNHETNGLDPSREAQTPLTD
ncbi:MAG: hypothetical protein HY706_09175 [Candidatus Hydrogenedentes bacterium]|nr:hypothetical protein [Candidatus Hydrogenedentota bacterium]